MLPYSADDRKLSIIRLPSTKITKYYFRLLALPLKPPCYRHILPVTKYYFRLQAFRCTPSFCLNKMNSNYYDVVEEGGAHLKTDFFDAYKNPLGYNPFHLKAHPKSPRAYKRQLAVFEIPSIAHRSTQTRCLRNERLRKGPCLLRWEGRGMS